MAVWITTGCLKYLAGIIFHVSGNRSAIKGIFPVPVASLRTKTSLGETAVVQHPPPPSERQSSWGRGPGGPDHGSPTFASPEPVLSAHNTHMGLNQSLLNLQTSDPPVCRGPHTSSWESSSPLAAPQGQRGPQKPSNSACRLPQTHDGLLPTQLFHPGSGATAGQGCRPRPPPDRLPCTSVARLAGIQ